MSYGDHSFNSTWIALAQILGPEGDGVRSSPDSG